MPLPSEVSAKELAHVLGLSVARVGQLEANGTFERTANGKFRLAESAQSYVKAQRADLTSRLAATPGSFAEARTRRMNTLAQIEALKLSERTGKLVETDVVLRVFGNLFTIVRQRLLALPSRLTPRLTTMRDPNETLSLLRKETNAVLELIASMLNNAPDDLFRGQSLLRGGTIMRFACPPRGTSMVHWRYQALLNRSARPPCRLIPDGRDRARAVARSPILVSLASASRPAAEPCLAAERSRFQLASATRRTPRRVRSRAGRFRPRPGPRSAVRRQPANRAEPRGRVLPAGRRLPDGVRSCRTRSRRRARRRTPAPGCSASGR